MLDASAAVELLLRTAAGRRTALVVRTHQVAVPAHFDAEVFSALGRLARAGTVSEETASDRIELLVRSPFRRYPVAPLLAGAWMLRDNVALRDALYVILTDRLGATLLTADRSLARAAREAVPTETV